MNNRVALSIITGVVFLVSGILKAADINAFADALLMVRIPKLYYMAPLLTAFEIFLAFAFLFQWRLRQIALISFVFISILTAVLLYGFFRWGVEDCGCFGSRLSLPFEWSLAKNIVLLAILYWLLKDEIYTTKKYNKVKLILISSLSLATFIPSFLELNSTYKPLNFFLGKSIKSTFLEKIISTKPEGKNLFFVFSPECPHCKEKVKVVNSQLGEFDKVTGIYAENYSAESIAEFRRLTEPEFDLIPVAFDSLAQITRRYPYFLIIKEGIIIKANAE